MDHSISIPMHSKHYHFTLIHQTLPLKGIYSFNKHYHMDFTKHAKLPFTVAQPSSHRKAYNICTHISRHEKKRFNLQRVFESKPA